MSLTWSFLRTRQRGVQSALVPFKDCGVTYYAYVVLCEDFSSQLRGGRKRSLHVRFSNEAKDVDPCHQQRQSRI